MEVQGGRGPRDLDARLPREGRGRPQGVSEYK